jgi:hypothetical protein
MPLQEVKPGAVGFGERRFLVRGRGASSEQQVLLLRPQTVGLPELFPVYPNYPAPGSRRGSSRPPRAVGGEGGEITEPFPPVTPNYPTPRPRIEEISISSLPPPSSPTATGINACVGDGGVSINRGLDVANGVTTVSVIGPISRPFVIRYVEVWAGGTDAARSNIGVRVSSDRTTSGGFDTSGVPLGLDISGDVDFSGHGQMHRTYPNFRWTSTPAFVKFIVFNNSGASQFYHLVMSLEWLN